MPVDHELSTPLYVQLKSLVVDQIERGELKPGDRTPSELQFERDCGVSRITVRQALSALVHEGRLYRIAGKGTYVASPKVEPLSEFTSFSENMAAQGLRASYRTLACGWVTVPAQVREELRLGSDTRVFRLYRLLLADDLPMCVQTGFYPEWVFQSIADQLTPALFSSTSLYGLFEIRLGLQLGKAEEVVEPALPTREEVQLLHIQRSVPVLVVNRRSYLQSGEPVETVKLVFRGDKYRYRVDLFRRAKSIRAHVRRADRRMRSFA